jgi:hypothetical protein
MRPARPSAVVKFENGIIMRFRPVAKALSNLKGAIFRGHPA